MSPTQPVFSASCLQSPADASELRARYAQDGYLCIGGILSPADCQELMTRAALLVDSFDPQRLQASLSVFSTTKQTQTTDDYFLDSGGQIRFFFEPRCVTPSGQLDRPRQLALNKLGHALHDLDPVFARHSRSPQLAAVCQALGIADPLLVQSMYIFKVPDLGGEVVSHQDATFLYTDPITCTGLWLALEDATVENGCLWVLPGGHRTTLRRRFVRTNQAPGTKFTVYDESSFAEAQMIPVEVPAGTLVVLHGLVPHRSGENRSPRSRHAYSVHVIEQGAHYPADNWLQRPATMPLRGFV